MNPAHVHAHFARGAARARVNTTAQAIQRSEPFKGAQPGTPRFNLRVEYGGLLFLSGIADDRGPTAMFPNDYKAQTELSLGYVDEQLRKAGSSKKHILKVVVYLRNIDEGIKPFNEAWDAWKDPLELPARTTVEAKMVRPDLLVEIDVIAARPPLN